VRVALSDDSTNYVLAGRIAHVIRFVAGLEHRTEAEVLNAAMRVYVRGQHPSFIIRDRPDGSFAMLQSIVFSPFFGEKVSHPVKPPQPLNPLPADPDDMTYEEEMERNAAVIADTDRIFAELKEKPMAPKPKSVYRKRKNQFWLKKGEISRDPRQDGNGGIPRSWGGK